MLIHNLINPESGKTYKEENLEKQHNIPVGSLVEWDDDGVRLFVLGHTRDCDGTPLYVLAARMDDDLWRDESRGIFGHKTFNNIAESSLQVIRMSTF